MGFWIFGATSCSVPRGEESLSPVDMYRWTPDWIRLLQAEYGDGTPLRRDVTSQQRQTYVLLVDSCVDFPKEPLPQDPSQDDVVSVDAKLHH